MTTPPGDELWLTDRQQRIWRQWLFVTGRLPAVLNSELVADTGISLQDFSVLVGLSESEGYRSRIAPLAAFLQWERSRLSHHVARMMNRGLVTREECGSDARGSWVVLTEEGRRALEDSAPGHVRTVRAMLFDLLDDDELAALDRITAKIRDTLESTHPQ